MFILGPVVVLLKYIALYKQLFLMFSLYCLFTSKKQDRLFFTSYIILLHEILAEIVPNKCLMSSWVMLTLKTSHQLFKKKKKKRNYTEFVVPQTGEGGQKVLRDRLVGLVSRILAFKFILCENEQYIWTSLHVFSGLNFCIRLQFFKLHTGLWESPLSKFWLLVSNISHSLHF